MKGSQSAHADFGIRRLTFGLFGTVYTFKVEGSLISSILIPMIIRSLLEELFFSLLKQMHEKLVIYLKLFFASKNTTL